MYVGTVGDGNKLSPAAIYWKNPRFLILPHIAADNYTSVPFFLLPSLINHHHHPPYHPLSWSIITIMIHHNHPLSSIIMIHHHHHQPLTLSIIIFCQNVIPKFFLWLLADLVSRENHKSDPSLKSGSDLDQVGKVVSPFSLHKSSIVSTYIWLYC